MSSASSRTLTEKRISQAEGWAVLACCVAASLAAIVWSWRHGAMLNYGDAVAHLHIARRVFDSRTAALFRTRLGVAAAAAHSAAFPLCRIYRWWANGLAGVIPSALAYIAACAGLYRLARRWLDARAAALALAFFALNPNLLYLQTTAMTEPLFLCEMIWIVVWMVEWRTALDKRSDEQSHAACKACIAAVLVAAIFTRYDGWIIALLGVDRHRPCFAQARQVALPRLLAGQPRSSSPRRLLWFTYNSVGFGDWLYFARGPFSAKAIELRTASPALARRIPAGIIPGSRCSSSSKPPSSTPSPRQLGQCCGNLCWRSPCWERPPRLR